jgi:hypothetical protein
MMPTNHSIEMDSFPVTQDLRGSNLTSSNDKPHSTRTTHKHDYAIGMGFILIVTLLWTLSSFVTQASSSSSRTVGQRSLCYNRTYMEVATINHSCMPESFVLQFFLRFLKPRFQGYLYEYEHALTVPNSGSFSILVES